MELKILNDITEICFNYDYSVKRCVLHKGLLNEIDEYLKKNKFRTKLEYPIKFETVRRKDREKQERNGFIDLVGISNKLKVAIELDTGTHSKFKSIEKLLQSKFDILIAIVGGRENDNKLSSSNLERIRSTQNLNFKTVNLIILKNKFDKNVY